MIKFFEELNENLNPKTFPKIKMPDTFSENPRNTKIPQHNNLIFAKLVTLSSPQPLLQNLTDCLDIQRSQYEYPNRSLDIQRGTLQCQTDCLDNQRGINRETLCRQRNV